MPETFRAAPRICGDDLVMVAVDDVDMARRIADRLRGDPVWREIVPGFRSVMLQFDPVAITASDAAERLRDTLADPGAEQDADELPELEVPVNYGGEDGPDFGAVCEQLRMRPGDFIRAHTAQVYRVELLGFTPGFAYVGALDPALAVPRLERPRQRVAPGAVGVVGRHTGLYALSGPGGWPLVGRTPLALFDAAATDPFLLHPGRRVRFRALGPGES